MKDIWSEHSFNGDYLSIPESTGSFGYLFHEIPGTYYCHITNDLQTTILHQNEDFVKYFASVVFIKNRKDFF